MCKISCKWEFRFVGILHWICWMVWLDWCAHALCLYCQKTSFWIVIGIYTVVLSHLPYRRIQICGNILDDWIGLMCIWFMLVLSKTSFWTAISNNTIVLSHLPEIIVQLCIPLKGSTPSSPSHSSGNWKFSATRNNDCTMINFEQSTS